MAEGPQIVLDRVSKRFGDGPLVLKEISLEARAGEIIAIVGPSGCGKSTLLRLIAGLTKPSDGEIEYSGQAPDAGFIFQDATLLPWARVKANIALPLRLKRLPRETCDSLAQEWAGKVGLGEVTGFYPRQLSGGMRMRVSIARAFCLNPNLLLMDEPFGALDAITRNHLNEEILRLHLDSSWTGFFVTHSVTEAAFLSHRMVILSHQPGEVVDIIANPLPFPRTASTRVHGDFQRFVAKATARLQANLPDEDR